MSELTVWVDGQFTTMNHAKASLMSHGLHYGTGVFEGIRCYETDKGPAIFRLQDHLDRFAAGTDALGMTVDVQSLGKAALELIRRNKQAAAYVRPLSFFELGGLGLDTAPLTPRSLVATIPWSNHLGNAAEVGLKMKTVSVRRTPADAVPPLKLCGNYVNSILAKREAYQEGFDEALFIDHDGYVVEATGENVFLVHDSKIVAVDHADALKGITRQTIIDLYDVEVRPVHLDELLSADEVFLTGTSAEVTWVSALDGVVYTHNPVTRCVAERYADVVHGRATDCHEWLTWT